MPDHLPGSRPGSDDAFARLNLIGRSSAFLEARRLVERLAPSIAPVLIQGETGTGKELFARAIHYLSDRRGGPFVPVNCGAIPDALVESELFGHVRGAFTDAREAREGLVAQARGGTLFLDELETLSPRGQIALLRFLQDQEYRPVGGRVVRDADVRVLGSTNVSLGALVGEGRYRQDLLFRLNVLSLELPPLRVRDEDAVLLAGAFLERLGRRYGRTVPTLDANTRSYLLAHAWPGNVRELENLVHREFLLADGPVLSIGTVYLPTPQVAPGSSVLTSCSFRDAKAQAVAAFERAYLAELLARAQGNVSLAARLAGKERSRLCQLLRKHGMRSRSFRSA
jgi:DNA-binding NtrC family response regulator